MQSCNNYIFKSIRRIKLMMTFIMMSDDIIREKIINVGKVNAERGKKVV